MLATSSRSEGRIAIVTFGGGHHASTYVEFDEDDEGCVWNIRVDWQHYDEAVLWKNVNLCKITALRPRYDPGSKTTSFIAE